MVPLTHVALLLYSTERALVHLLILGRGPEGQLLACVVGESVQTHVHAIHLDRQGSSTLAWERYYGEVYVVPGVGPWRM